MGANSLLMWVNNSSIRINKLFSWTNNSLIRQRISLSRLALRLTPQGVCSPILKHHVRKKKKIESNQLLSLNDNTLQMSSPQLPLLRHCLGAARAVSSPTAASQINPGLLPQCVFWCSLGSPEVTCPPLLHGLLTDTILGDFCPVQRISRTARRGKRPSIMS